VDQLPRSEDNKSHLAGGRQCLNLKIWDKTWIWALDTGTEVGEVGKTEEGMHLQSGFRMKAKNSAIWYKVWVSDGFVLKKIRLLQTHVELIPVGPYRTNIG
jgi:hypothetical protein